MASTSTALPRPTVASSNITDGSIVNADVNASAAIAVTKLAAGAANTVLHGGASNAFSAIVNADVDAAAAIATTKLAGTSLVRCLSFTVALDATTDSTAVIPAGAYITNCQVIINTQYSASGTISVGQVGSTTAFQATTDNDADGATAGDIFEKVQFTAVPTGGAVVRATVGGAPAAGAARVVVFYAVPDV